MDDLYEDLGVARDADEPTIRKAYRSKAKKAHPDAGGSHEEMAKLSRAVTVLSDPAAREQYDRTGNADMPPREKMVQEALIGCVMSVIDGLSSNPGADVCAYDLVAIATNSMLEKEREIVELAAKARREAARFTKVAGRLKGADVLKNAILSRAKAAEQTAAMHEEHIEVVREAVKRLSGASFEFDLPPDPPQYYPQGYVLNRYV